MPFWLDHCVDRSGGGFFSFLDERGGCYETDKSGWVQGRFTWLLSKLCTDFDGPEEWRSAAEHGVRFIREHGYTPDRRLWFMMNREGAGLRKRRYAYTEFFGSMALGQWSKLANDEDAATESERLFLLACTDMRTCGARGPGKWEDARVAQSLGVPMITLGAAHALEGCVDSEAITSERRAAIAKIQADFVHPETGCLLECVGAHGEYLDHVDGRQVNPGHAIEAAWFLMEECRRRPNQELLALALRVLDSAWELGWDEEHGGLFSLVDISGAPNQDVSAELKYWWPHCEAIIAFLYAALLTGSSTYSDRWRIVHDWAHEHFVDTQNGEWFGYLRRDGSVMNSAKGNLWKGPFHIPRMQFMAADLCSALAAKEAE
jgi:N-acylglucosamine 2-epimerase